MVMGRSLHHALDRDPIFRAVSSFYGVTTANGLVTTLVCNALVGSNDFITGKTILLDSGVSAFETRGATVFAAGSGTITVNPAFSAPVLAGTGFYILTQGALAAAIGGPSQGLFYYGVVTAVPGVGQFTIPTLAGLGANKFIDTGLVNQYYAFVFRDASGPGAAPQGESRPITGYATLTGNFVVNPNFTADVAAGDEILIIHPFLARIMNLYGLPPVTGSLTTTWGDGAEHNLVSIGTANVKYKLHMLTIGIQNLVGHIAIRFYMLVSGVELRIYPIPAATTFGAVLDAPAIPVINSTMGIHEVLRVTVQSDNAADNAKAVSYDYMLEAM